MSVSDHKPRCTVLVHRLNILAELLCFGDREFYKDWWNAKSVGDVSFHQSCLIQKSYYVYVTNQNSCTHCLPLSVLENVEYGMVLFLKHPLLFLYKAD